jgi:hypothetical protein
MAQAPKKGARQEQEQQSDSAFTFEQFAGLNTAAVRAGVPEEQAAWLDGFMPLEPRLLRTLWGAGPPVYSAHPGNTIVLFGFYNIGATPYAVVFESDGSAYQLNVSTLAVTTILPAGSIVSPSPTNIGFCQYAQQYLIIVSNIPNGYWVWDGTVLYSAGSLAPGVVLTNVGAGYVSPPAVSTTGGHGGGATFSAQIANGIVTGVSITNAGSGWIATDNTSSISSVSLVFTGGSPSTPAAGTVTLSPFGVGGTVVQTYSGHVWVFNGNFYTFTASGSVSNFATSAGGGAQTSSDNFLRVGYTQAIQTNGFLFVLGDSSMNYISGVTTTGTPPTTNFTNQNSDPEIGTPYPYAVITLGQDILAANATGVFVSSGGGFVKRSEALDGVYNSVPNFASLQLSAAKATIFGKRVWMVLVPIIDPITGTPQQSTNQITVVGGSVLNFNSVPATVVPGTLVYDWSRPAIPIGTSVLSKTSTTVTLSNNVVQQVGIGDTIFFFQQKLMMFNGKQWWAYTGDVTLTFIAGQEINSTFTAYGTDGFSIYPLFVQPSVLFFKTARTKYWDDPGYEGTKTATRFWSLWQIYNPINTTFTLTIDAVGLDSNNNQFVNNQVISMNANGATGTVIPTIPEAVGQQGVLLGFTIITNAADMALVSAKMLPGLYQYRG